jgi:phage terminase large subunit-like protein
MWLFGQAAGFVDRTPGLAKRFRVLEGYRRIECLRTNGRIQVYASDDRTGDGAIPTLALLEELHRQNLRLYRTWRGKLDKRDGQLVGISTAGAPDSEYELVKQEALTRSDVSRKGCHTVARAPDFVLHQHALQPTDDLHDLELVKQANPFSGVSLESLRRKHDSPTMRVSHWARFTCGVSIETEESWIDPEAWDACKGILAIEDGQDVFVGVDVGQKKDSTAIVLAAWVDDKLHIKAEIVTPKPGHPNAAADARATLGELNDIYRLIEVPYDPWHFSESAEMLEDRGIPMVEFPQTDARMAPASEALFELITAGRLVHDGDPELRRQMLAAVPARTERGVKISKRKSKRRIDAAVAVAMAAHRAIVSKGQPRPFVEVWA